MPKFRVLDGTHQETDSKGVLRTYKKGQVVESKLDLAKRFNRRSCIRFKMVSDDTAVSVPPPVGTPPTPEEMNLDLPQEVEEVNETEGLEEDTREAELEAVSDDALKKLEAKDGEIQDVYTDLSREELKQEAEEANVDLKGLRTAKQIRARLRAAAGVE